MLRYFNKKINYEIKSWSNSDLLKKINYTLRVNVNFLTLYPLRLFICNFKIPQNEVS